jgi:hypothetical protein
VEVVKGTSLAHGGEEVKEALKVVVKGTSVDHGGEEV